MNGMIYLTSAARLLAQANGGDAAEWLDLLIQAVAARELAAPRGGGDAASILPGGVSYIPRGCEMRVPVAGFIRWCEQHGYSLGAHAQGKPNDGHDKPGPREAQIRQIEAAARAMGYGGCLLAIPRGGRARIRDACGDLSDDSFKRSWSEADRQGRLRVENKENYVA